jgi:ABC-type polysaccharide/polyol phosphate export permease
MFWFTPIFYALPMVRTNLPAPLYYLYLLNPLAGCIDACSSGGAGGSWS